jgi:hypothetical protein
MIRRVLAALVAAGIAGLPVMAPAAAPHASPLPELRPSQAAPDGGEVIVLAVLAAAPVIRQRAARPPQGGEFLVQAVAVASGPVVRPQPRPLLQITPGLLVPAAAATARPMMRPAPTPSPRAEGIHLAAVLPLTPRPRQRPGDADRSTRQVATALAVARSLVPRKRTETDRLRYLQRAAAVRSQPSPGAIIGRDSGSLCGVSGIQGSTIPPITSNVQGCGIANPVRVTAVDGVALSKAAVLHCDTARALHAWVRDGLRPAIGATGGGPEQLRVAAHYICRTRNHQRGAAVSEHGRGRAIDISAIRLKSGEIITVLAGWRDARQGRILRAMHQAACGTFATTLGPGSDGYHEDHFHYDTAQRRTSRAICR